jgi:hypothetical protein
LHPVRTHRRLGKFTASPKIEDGYDYRYKRWMDNGVLSFIPPDGEFKLLDYQVAVPAGTLRPIGLPLNLKAKMSTEVGGGRYWCCRRKSLAPS